MTSDSEHPNTDQVNLAEGGNTAPCGDKAAVRGEFTAAPRMTPEDAANVARLLKRLRTGEMNLIPSLTDAALRDAIPSQSEALLHRVEQHLSDWINRKDNSVDPEPAFPVMGAASDHQFCGLHTREMKVRPQFRVAANDEPEPMVSRHCADTAKEGASHATTTHDDDCIDQFLNRRRPEAQEPCLTQQATNRTSVTARKDGQFIRELDARIAAEIRAERRGQP